MLCFDLWRSRFRDAVMPSCRTERDLSVVWTCTYIKSNGSGHKAARQFMNQKKIFFQFNPARPRLLVLTFHISQSDRQLCRNLQHSHILKHKKGRWSGRGRGVEPAGEWLRECTHRYSRAPGVTSAWDTPESHLVSSAGISHHACSASRGCGLGLCHSVLRCDFLKAGQTEEKTVLKVKAKT